MSTSVYRRMTVPSTASSTMTATWPGKVGKLPKKVEPKSKRPETATLEKPLVLDPKLLRKLDMTTLCRDKLLTIENLIISPRSDSGKKERCSTGEPKTKRISRGLNTTYRIRSNGRKRLVDVFGAASVVNNNVGSQLTNAMETEPQGLVKRVSKVPTKTSPLHPKDKRKVETLKSVKEAMMIESVTESVPPPCCTCGRPEQPERLHSHPVRVQVKKSKLPRSSEAENVPSPQIQPKSSVRKPNAIKFRSNRVNLPEPIPEVAKQSPVARKRMNSPEVVKQSSPVARKNTFRVDSSKKPEVLHKLPPESPRRSPKTSQIPISRRQLSSKPTVPPRTPPPFVPTLNPVQHSPPSTGCSRERPDTSSATSSPTSSPRKPRTVVCYLCMREFGTASLPLHEPHCLQRWERENAALPPHLQRSPPSRPDRALSPSQWNKIAYETAQASLVPCDKCGRTFLPHRLPLHVKACLGIKRSSNASAIPTALPPSATVKVVEDCKTGEEYITIAVKEGCFICGRVVSPEELANHEEACLARWQVENDKLAPHLRHPLPTRPGGEEEDGKVDRAATDEVFWQSHLVQLVPCSKCQRTFNPDRVDVHEKACKGPINKH